METPQPIFVSPDLDRTAEGMSVLLARLDLYGKYLSELDAYAETKLIVLAGIEANKYKLIETQNYSYLKILRVSKPTRNSMIFAIKCRLKILKSRTKVSILIAADLYYGFLCCYFIAKIMGLNSRIQISIHGSLMRANETNLKRVMRAKYLSFVLRNSDSIRVVSDELLKSISHIFNISEERFLVSHVPVDIPIQQPGYKHKKVIGFVGRMHAERGIEDWIQIVHLLSLKRLDFELFIIGDGPLHDEFLSNLEKLRAKVKVETFGYLNRSDLEKKWGEIKVLLSTAPAEGYGLTLREAISMKTFVCARNSHGSAALIGGLSRVLQVYYSQEEAVSLLDRFLDDSFPIGISEGFVEELKNSNTSSIKALVKSWV